MGQLRFLPLFWPFCGTPVQMCSILIERRFCVLQIMFLLKESLFCFTTLIMLSSSICGIYLPSVHQNSLDSAGRGFSFFYDLWTTLKCPSQGGDLCVVSEFKYYSQPTLIFLVFKKQHAGVRLPGGPVIFSIALLLFQPLISQNVV